MMRVAMNLKCPACKTTHEVSGRPAGTLVSCRCGETFGFPAAVDALVHLQCTGCGARAEPGEGRCSYCDLPLRCVCCPNCFALMAAGDRHCTRCGVRVETPAVAVHRHGEPTLPCPRCSSALTANLIGDQLFDRCDRCAGIWAHHLALAALFAERGQRYSVSRWLERVARPDAQVDTRRAAPCPDCEQPMQRQRLDARGKLLVDCCNDHGIWFDFRELRTIVGPARPPRESRRPHRQVRRATLAAHLEELEDWWPFEALDDLIDFLDELFD